MLLYFTTTEGKRVIDYSKHILEDFFPHPIFEGMMYQVEYCKMQTIAQESLAMYKSSKSVLAVYSPDEFQKCLFQLLGEKGFEGKVSTFYNKTGISRQVFANILSYNKEYTPTKETLYKIIFTLELSYDEAKKLLRTKGYTISRSVKFDVVAGYCLENEIYDQDSIDRLMLENCQTSLFSDK